MSKFEILIIAKTLNENVEACRTMIDQIVRVRGVILSEEIFDQITKNTINEKASDLINKEIAYAFYDRILEIIKNNDDIKTLEDINIFLKENFSL